MADLNRLTWRDVEGGVRLTRDTTHRKMERVLRWKRGSIAAFLGAKTPPDLDEPTEPTQLGLFLLDAMVAGNLDTTGLAKAAQTSPHTITDWIYGAGTPSAAEWRILFAALPMAQLPPILHRLAGLLGPDSPLSAAQRDDLDHFLAAAVSPYEQLAATQRTA